MPNRIFGKLLDIAKNIKDRCQVNRNTEKNPIVNVLLLKYIRKKIIINEDN